LDLQNQITDQKQTDSQNIENKLETIDQKINLLLDNQTGLSQLLKLYFNPHEQSLIFPLGKELNESSINEIQSFLEVLDNNQISETDIQLMVGEVQSLFAEINASNVSLTSANKSVIEMIRDPNIDAKHVLKLSIPIIPLFLNYEAELGLSNGIKLKDIWHQCKSIFQRK
jgi:hypothetical protein